MFDDFDLSFLDGLGDGGDLSGMSGESVDAIINGDSYSGGFADAFGGASDSIASYNNGSAFANQADFQNFAPQSYDYTGIGEQPGALGQVGVPDGANRAQDSQRAWANGSANQNTPSIVDKLLKAAGVQSKDGSVDWSNPKTLDSVMKLILGGGNMINALVGGNKPKGYASAADLRAQVAGPYDKFNDQQQGWAQRYFNTPAQDRGTIAAAQMKSPVVRGYADGGPVGALTLIEGDGGGQDDIVDASLAPGEFVWDADSVSAAGDGSNEEGARVLEELRQNLRGFKRAAPPDQIPPPTGDIRRFMPQGALSHTGGGNGRA